MEHERNKIIIKSISPLMARKTDWRCSTMDHRSPSPSPSPSESHFLIGHQKNGKKRLIKSNSVTNGFDFKLSSMPIISIYHCSLENNRTSLKALLGDMIMVTFKNI
jgi:hypothetical protein